MSDSVPLVIDSLYTPLYKDEWLPFVHYVPVKNDQSDLYEKIVPTYLLEDHPAEIPSTAKNLIRKVGDTKGNGMPAEQLDLELSILFRNNDR